MILHNRVNKEELKESLMQEEFTRMTISFYRYIRIDDPQKFRDELYKEWEELNCFGRIYIAREGINAQMSLPEDKHDEFLQKLHNHVFLKDIPIKYAIEDDGKSFYKLTIKVRPKIVADGLAEDEYDVSNVGTHLSAIEFHQKLEEPDTVVVDMRNHYESEVGRFENAICPDVDTFKEELEQVTDILKDQKDQQVLLYCTGGIRCEKASAYLKHQGFKNVNQLHGGVLEYIRQIKQTDLSSKFIGKNFVFDERLGERVTEEVISHCHQCGSKSDHHSNCANDDCHLLFIQCQQCGDHYEGCCSEECKEINQLPKEKRLEKRKELHEKYSESKIFRSKRRFNERMTF